VTGTIDGLLLLVVLLDLAAASTTRLSGCIRASAVMGGALAVLVAVVGDYSVHACIAASATLVLKAIAIPRMLQSAIHKTGIRREVEPFVSQHVSLLATAALVGLAFWMGSALPVPVELPSPLLVPVAFSTVLVGFWLLLSRKKAVTQVVGYLVLENGIFLFGLGILREMPIAIEVALLLDLLVAVFVMGLTILRIRQAFDHVDTDALSELRD
jgi:hydrogenase-4 component E